MKIILIVSSLLYPLLLYPNQLSKWISSTDRGSNDVIIELIKSDDLGTGIEAVRALGLREDPYVGDIIQYLYFNYSHSRYYEEELLLRFLLSSVFFVRLDGAVLTERLSINHDGIDLLVKNLYQFHDSLLKAEIVRIIPLARRKEYLSVLLAVGRELEGLLKRQKGRLNTDQVEMFLQFLQAAETTGSPDFTESCLSIYELTRHPQVASRAGEAVRMLTKSD